MCKYDRPVNVTLFSENCCLKFDVCLHPPSLLNLLQEYKRFFDTLRTCSSNQQITKFRRLRILSSRLFGSSNGSFVIFAAVHM